MSYIANYLDQVAHILQSLDQETIAQIIETLRQARLDGRRIYTMGNGGSASTASHFVNDMLKSTVTEGLPRIRISSLADNVSTMLAYANDDGYETIFAQQLDALAEPGDILIGFSGSGRSPNIIKALDLARERGLTTIGLTARDGGEMVERCDICLVAPCELMEQIEDVHVVVTHLVYAAIRDQAEV